MSSEHPVVRFLRRRLSRSVPYGLGFTLAFAFVVMALAGFVGLAELVFDRSDLLRYDAAAHDILYGAFGRSASLGLAVTWFGNNATLTTLVIVVGLSLILSRRPWAAFRVVFASGVGGLVSLGLKALFARARPIDQVIEATGYSFPSGHAFASTVFYGMLVYLVWRLTPRPAVRTLAAVVGGTLILAVGLSRVYLNVHYITDVIGGWLAGGAWLVASLLLIDIVEGRTRSKDEEREDATHPPDAEPPPSSQAVLP